MKWTAHYDDGSTFEGAYADIDRDHLTGFSVEGYYLAVPPGSRLVWRERHSIGKNVWDVDIVGLEDAERDAEVWLFYDGRVKHQSGYGISVMDAPPVLLDCEV